MTKRSAKTQKTKRPTKQGTKAKSKPISASRLIDITDMVDTQKHFAEGISDAVYGLAHLSRVNVSGVATLLADHIASLEAISAALNEVRS